MINPFSQKDAANTKLKQLHWISRRWPTLKILSDHGTVSLTSVSNLVLFWMEHKVNTKLEQNPCIDYLLDDKLPYFSTISLKHNADNFYSQEKKIKKINTKNLSPFSKILFSCDKWLISFIVEYFSIQMHC